METKFTPGPWSAKPVESKDRIVYCLIGPAAALRRMSGVAYAGTYGKTSRFETKGIRQSDEECKANAHLIAAAPDLYEALENAQKRLEQQQRDGTIFEEVAETLDEVCAALKKARGEV